MFTGGGDGGAGGGGGVGLRALTTPAKMSVRSLNYHVCALLTMVDVSVVCDDLLDDRRADFWLWSWRRWWGRWRGRR